MFDLLKKKLNSFTGKVKERLETKEQPTIEETPEQPKPQEKPEILEKPEAPEKPEIQETWPEEAKAPQAPEPEETEKPREAPEAKETVAPEPEETEPREAPEPKTTLEEPETPEGAEKKKEVRKLKPKIGIKGRLKSAITGELELKETDLKDLLWELELALLEADVEQTTAEEITKEIKQRLSGKKISKKTKIEETIKKEIGEILQEMMQTEQPDLIKEIRAKKEKPYKILLLGPNGSGKTTSIAKLTHLLQKNGLKTIWAAADTFRAASIEQLEKHGQKLGTRIIKHQYGADPTAVAFDAVKAAQSKRIDVVLIDSAGRQETNKNLMGELQKMSRVIKPDLKLYVGEAYTGQALLQQASEYEKAAGIDGFILTKIDCDAKGGTTISLLYKLKKPVLFVGTGQEYKDLQPFTPEFIVKRVIG